MSIDSIGAVTPRAENYASYYPSPAQVRSNAADSSGLTPEQQQEVKELKEKDAKVRQHEQAHLMAAGTYAKGGAAYKYKTGPDGKRYAVGGEVKIDSSPIPNDPEATIKKAQIIKRAALAPAEPSAQDYRVAAQADQMELKARQELAQTGAAEQGGYNKNGRTSDITSEPAIFDLTI
jgi:hypothetical protein